MSPIPRIQRGDLLLGRYQVGEILGEGGEGRVHEGVDTEGGGVCALKLLPLEGTSPDSLRDEVDLLRELQHPGIVRLLDGGVDSGRGVMVLVMERVRGRGLAEVLPDLDAGERALLLERLLDAVAALHRRGLLHGDLKPANILVREGKRSRPVLVDFGLAGPTRARAFSGGTPAYMAPEVVAGGAADQRSDLFSLGVSWLQGVLGLRRPRRTLPPGDLLEEPLRTFLRRLLQRRPERRFSDADAALTCWRRSNGRGSMRLLMPARLPLIEREEEMGAADEALHSILPGREDGGGDSWTVVTLSGPRGSGRRRWLQEVHLRARALGLRSVPAPEGGALRDLVRKVLVACGVAGEEAERKVRDLFAPASLPGMAREPLEERAAGLVLRCAGKDPLLIGAFLGAGSDPALRAFLTTLGRMEETRRACGEPPRLLLLAAGEEADVELFLRRRAVRAAPFTPAGIRALLVQLSGLPRPTLALGRMARLLHVATGGLPLLVEESLRVCAARGLLTVGEEDLLLADEERLQAAVRGRLAEVLRSALEDLDADEKEVVSLLGAAQRALPRRALLEAAGARAEEALDRLLERGLLRVPSGVSSGVRLASSELGEVALAEHGAEALRRLYARLSSVLPGRDGLRFRLLAGDARAGPEVLPAVRRLLEEGRLRAAREVAEAGLASGLPAKDQRAGLRVILARMDLASGWIDRARGLLEPLADEPGDVGAEVALLLCDAALARGDDGEARRLARRALERARSPGIRVRAACAEGYAALRTGRVDEAGRAAARAGEHAEGRLVEEAMACNLDGLVLLEEGRDEEAGRCFEEAAERFSKAECPFESAAARTNLAMLLSRSGRPEAAVDLLVSACTVFGEGGHSRRLAVATTNLALAWDRLGRSREAARMHGEARRLFLAVGEAGRAALARASRGMALLRGGRCAEARRELAAALEGLQRRREALLVKAALARALAALGRRRGAWRRAMDVLRRTSPERAPRIHGLALLALAEADASRVRRWRRALRAREFLEQAGDLRGAAEAGLAAAEAAFLAGRQEAACAALEMVSWTAPDLRGRRDLLLARHQGDDGRRSRLASAVRAAARAEDPLFLMRARLTAAALLLAAGNDGRALRQWRRARSLMEDMEQNMTGRAKVFFRVTQAARDLERLTETVEKRMEMLGRTRRGAVALELTEIFRLLAALNAAGRMRPLLDQVIASALELTGGERGYVLLLDREDLRVAAARDREGRRIKTPLGRVSTSITHEVMATGNSLVLADAIDDERYRDLMSVARNRIRSLACVPLRTEAERLGALYLDGGQRAGAFTEEHLPLLEAYAHLAALAIRNLRRTRHIQEERERLERDLQTQRSVARALRRGFGAGRPGTRLVGKSPRMLDLDELIGRAARTELSILVTGETGAGKELVAREVHARSARSGGPFVTQSCANMQESLFESELFGHRKGAFTGAEEDAPGLFLLADGGTLFLDEIGELPLKLQARLLRVIQEGSLRAVGAVEETRVDVRVVTATNRDLADMVARGAFREDLYYRLRGLEIPVPPLRERAGDIPDLVFHFLEVRGSERRPTERAMQALVSYSWPGNVRQLKHEIERADALCRKSRIDLDDLSPEIVSLSVEPVTLVDDDGVPVSLKEAERRLISRALVHTGNDRSKAARLLGISRSTLYEKLKGLR